MIYMLGDVHGHFDHVIDIVQRDRPKAVIFLGDLDCRSAPLHEILAPIRDLTQVWWVPGNHDTDDQEAWANLTERNQLAGNNLHGRIAEIDGVRVAGLGGVFRDVWYPPAEPKFGSYDEYLETLRLRQPKRLRESVRSLGSARKHKSSIFPADYNRLLGQKADILVCHEAPTSHHHGFGAIDELARGLGVQRVFHGHHHVDYKFEDERLGFQVFGVGYCGVTRYDGEIIAPGDNDEAQKYLKGHSDGP